MEENYLNIGTKMTKNGHSLKIGTNFGFTSGSTSSFNRAGCLLDCGGEVSACNVVCSESANSTIDSTSGNVINQILYITPDKVTFYKLKSSGKVMNKSFDISKLKNFNYQKFLAVGYNSQTDYDTAQHFAEYISATPTWKDKINAVLGKDNKIEFWTSKGSGYDTKLNFDEYGEDVNKYKYSGIFVFYSIGAGTGQGRMTYRIVQDKANTPVKIKFKKQDFNGIAVAGAKIKITKDNNVSKIQGRNGDNELVSNGEGVFVNGSNDKITVYPGRNNGKFRIKIKETSAPIGYSGFSGSIVLEVKYNTETGAVNSITNVTNSSKNIATNVNSNNVGVVTVKNNYKTSQLNIMKIDSLTGGILADSVFNITIDNIKSADGISIPSGQTKVTIPNQTITGRNGWFSLYNLVFADEKSSMTIKLEEIKVPTGDGCYYKTIDPITITINATTKNGKAVFTVTTSNTTTSAVGVSGDFVSIEVKNKPLIRLSGAVWEDGQIGVKDIAGPNGKKDSEEKGLKDVLVGLYSLKDKKILNTIKTDADGKYKFEDIEQTVEGYKIVFSYDGINWQETKSLGSEGTDSKATEINRDTFNGKFKTISKDTSNASVKLGYNYDENGKTSKLQVNMDGTNPANNNAADFQMGAESGVYTKMTDNIDCGLVKKELDLGLMTDVEKAEVKINGKETTYNYGQIVDSNYDLEELLNSKSSDKIDYNANIDYSDYYYRIEDYKTDETGIENKQNPGDENNLQGILSEDNELQVYVTYKVELLRQTYKETTVDEFVYYYDEKYEPYNIPEDQYKANIDKENNKITFTSTDKTPKVGDNGIIIYLTFKVGKDSTGNLKIGNFTNLAEITKYSTDEGGLIDRDSAPGNGITVNNNTAEITQYEDDTDQAPGLNIKLTNEERKISGKVFEDNSKDGIINANDDGVNDVIVQLIEIIGKGNGNRYEYIWQETRSGSNKVKTTARNGYQVTEYTNNIDTERNKGQYEFKGYIPGNYIIRYIYGDGTTYDFDGNGNIAKYNGQDYKSTKDSNYAKEYYNEAGYSRNVSVARDNESRRLEVMSYSSMIDSKIGGALNALTNKGELSETEKNILNNYYEDIKASKDNDGGYANYALETLKKFTKDNTITFENISDENKYKLIQYYVSNKTWMCAETSLINVMIDADDSKKTGTNSGNTEVYYNNITDKNTVSFECMNFGLALRPQTKLVLEKHITGLKITPNGTGVQSIIDARANINNIINGNEVSTEGVTEGLATTKSTVDNRGFWEVATDIEELAQGAQLEVEYTYVIRNDGEKDYLSSELINRYKQNPDEYSSYLKGKAGDIKNTLKGHTNTYGKYLGQYYYNRNSTGCLEVPTRIEANGLEEALNNDLKFDSSEEKTSGEDFKKTSGSEEKTVYDTNGKTKPENIETIVQNTKESDFLTPGNKDYKKTITLRTVLSASSGGELGTNLPSYIAEVIKYSNAAGRRDMEAEPENLSYVHSDETGMTMRSDNEHDEFWGETVIITKPTGEDKITPMQIAIITVTATAVLGVGIILIKKYVLKK